MPDFSETHEFDLSSVGERYRESLLFATGRSNRARFRSFEPGDCMLLGASAKKTTGGKYSIAFRFTDELEYFDEYDAERADFSALGIGT